MKDKHSTETAKDSIGVWNDPELEARLIAMQMGELSAFEVAEMEEELEKSPELRLFRDRMEEVQGLIREVSLAGGEDSDDDGGEEWSLSADRREALLGSFAEVAEGSSEVVNISTSGLQWRNVFSVAACFLLSAAAFMMMFFKRNVPVFRDSLEMVSYSLRSEKKSYESRGFSENIVVWGGGDGEGILPQTEEEEGEVIVKPEMSSKVEMRPSSPSGSMAKVIAASSPSAIAVPMPEAILSEPSLDFGDGDDFGDGWGRRDEAGGEIKSAEAKDSEVSKNGLAALKGRMNYAYDADPFGDDESAIVDAFDDESRMVLPNRKSKPRSKKGKEQRGGEVSVEKLAMPEGVNKTLEIIDEALDGDPDNVLAKKHLEYLDDRTRSSATMTNEHVKNVNKIRKSLYRATGYSDLAQFDQAMLEYKEILRIDPYNKAARLGMEKVSAAKNGYYRSAYDQTRASMLMKVDQEWEQSVEGKDKVNEKKVKLTKGVLSAVEIPEVKLDENATVGDAIQFLKLRTRELDSDGQDQSLKIAQLDENIAGQKLGALRLRNIPIEDALREICKLSNLRYKVGEDGIRIVAATDVDTNDMYAKTFKAPEGFVDMLRGNVALDDSGDPFGEGDIRKEASVNELMERLGLTFPDGSKVDYDKERGTLTVRNTMNELDNVAELIKSLEAKSTQRVDLLKEISAAEQTHSTFSLNVSDVSYQLAKTLILEKGGEPEAEKVRVEEFVNAFDYGDPGASGKKVNCVVEQCAHPFYQQRNLMRIGMKTGAMGRSQPLRLTVLLDNSGSMEREDRAKTVLKAVEALASQLGPEDEVTLMSFARGVRLVAQKVKGNEAHKLVELVKGIPSEGGTNLSLAIQQAYAAAKQTVEEGAMSRIVLITDGAANLGNADPEALSKSIVQMRQKGIAFDACGVGGDGLDDDMLEALTRKGDGRYYFINKPEDADAGFAQKLAGALRPAAKNVKVQVVFNPKRVGSYRLVGFEKHRLKKQDFRNDKVDAAEMAAEEAGNAVYQVEAQPDGEGDVGTVFVRFRDMASGKMVERSWVIPYDGGVKSLKSADPSMQLAAVAAMLGERLKLGGDAGINLGELGAVYGALRNHYHADDEVKDLIRMCEKVDQ